MNNLLGFIFLVAMYFGLNEANSCVQNKLEIQNKLGPGRILKVQCNDSPRIHWLKFNENYLFPHPFIRHRAWQCVFTHWPTKQPYMYRLLVELKPQVPPCIHGFRSWTAKVDGIYFEQNRIKPPKRLSGWTKEGEYPQN